MNYKDNIDKILSDIEDIVSKRTIVRDFSVAESMLRARYCFKEEKSYLDIVDRMLSVLPQEDYRTKFLRSAMKHRWVLGATPELSNLGTVDKTNVMDIGRGLPISCFVTKVIDDMGSIIGNFRDIAVLGSLGGGVGIDFSDVSGLGEKIKNGTTAGIIPFIQVHNALTIAISQGSLRRASFVVKSKIGHPDYFEFLNVRNPNGGDANRKALKMHHTIEFSDEFMESVLLDTETKFKEVRNGNEIGSYPSFDLLTQYLDINTETGEPFAIFTGNTKRNRSKVYELNDIHVINSNLCMEILLEHTTDEIAVCCLASFVLEYFDEFAQYLDLLVESTAFFLHHVLEETYKLCDIISIRKPEYKDTLAKVKKAIRDDHSIGLGVMGYHTGMQKKGIAFESPMAVGYTRNIFSKIRKSADLANEKLGHEFGACTKAARVGLISCFSNMIAIAPTSSISIIAGVPSPGIDPDLAVCYNLQQEEGANEIRNPYFAEILKTYAEERGLSDIWIEDQWRFIRLDRGSVQNLEWLDDNTKLVYKTAFEIDQNYVVEHAAVRQESIDQSQSLNLWFRADCHKKELFNIFVKAWKLGCKTLYYRRMRQTVSANSGSDSVTEVSKQEDHKYQECVNCQ